MHPKLNKSFPILVLVLLLLQYCNSVAQIGEIRDCNGNDIDVQVTVRSSNNQVLNLVGCTFVQGKLSEFLNCIKANNTSLPASASLFVQLSAEQTSGINAMDLLLLKRDILQINTISNTCNRVASDIDVNNKINTIDFCLVRKENLGISSLNPTWKFYKSQNLSLSGIGSITDLVFPVADFPLSALNIVAVHNGNVNQVTTPNDTCLLLCQPSLIITPGQDEVRKLTPDYFLLNKSCNFPNLSLQMLNESGQIIANDITQNMTGSQLTATLKIGNTSQICTTKLSVFSCESTVNIDVDQINTEDSTFVDLIVKNGEFISGYQLSLKFDTTLLQFAKIEKGSELGFSIINDTHYNGIGHVNFSRFSDMSNLGLEDGTRLFRIKFKRKSSIINSVVIDPENVETLLFDSNKNEYCTDITYLKDLNPPVCLQDTIHIQASIATGYGIVKFTNYAADDFGTVIFNSGLSESDVILTEIHTFPCGTNILTFVTFRDANGQIKECIFRVIIDCPIENCENKYLYFDGVNDRINIANQHTGNVEFTIECWFKSDNTIDGGSGNFHRLLTLGSSNRIELGDQIGRLLYFDGSGTQIGPNIRDNKWHHVAIVRDSPFVRVYLDGIQILNKMDPAIDLRSLRVGYFDNNGIFTAVLWKGGIDEIKLWNRGLTTGEINESKNKINTNKKDCGLIGYWRMEDGISVGNNQTITIIRDSIQENHGSLVGFDLVGSTSNFLCNDSLNFTLDTLGCCTDKKPKFENCPPKVLGYVGNNCTGIVSFPVPVVIDPCNGLEALVSCTRDDNMTLSSPYLLGITKITCIVVASNFLRDTCNFDVEVRDTIKPICNGKTLNKIINGNGNASFAAIDLNNNSTDNCSDVMFAASKTMFTCEDVRQTNIVTLTVTDESGNSSSCQVEVKLTDPNDYCGCMSDVTPPICKTKNINLDLDVDGNALITPEMINDVSVDFCSDIMLQIEGALTYDCNSLGTQLVYLVVTDQANNISTCSAEVMVTDKLRPSCELPATLYLDQNGQAALSSNNPNIILNDNCGIVNITNPKSYDCNDIGNRFISLTVSDISGNTNICARNINIRDTIQPTCIIPPKTLFLQGNGQVAVTQSQLNIVSNDNCFGVTTNFNNINYNCNDIGLKNIFATVRDGSGNTSTCSALITIRDTISPNCSSRTINKSIESNGSVSISATELNNNSGDNCGNPLTFVASKTMFTCDDLNKINIVILTVTDKSGNTSFCPAEVKLTDPNNYCECIDDTTAPDCKSKNINLYLDDLGQANLTAAQIDNGSTDNCSAVTLIVGGATSFDCNSLGQNSVSLVTTDQSNNVSFCEAEITVLDTIAPVCSSKTINLAINEIGTASFEAIDLNNNSTDNCSGVLMFTAAQTIFSCSDLNQIQIVELTVEDESGNTSSCPVEVKLTDPNKYCECIDEITPPDCKSKNINLYLDGAGQTTLTAAQIDNGSLDACSAVTLMIEGPTSFNCSNLGQNNVFLVVNDQANNVAFCESVITVLDTIKPICNISNLEIVSNDGTGAIVTFNGAATDNCTQGLTISYSSPSGQFYPCGTYPITMTATDASGNKSSCNFNLTVKDCDGCCRSQQAFMDSTNVMFGLSSQFLTGRECVIEFAPPNMSTCQRVKEINWGDGTVSRGAFTNESDFLHQYLAAGLYEVCVSYEENNGTACYSNKKCETFEVLDNCTLLRSSGSFDFSKIHLFPNPTQTLFYISAPGFFSDYQLFNGQGKLMKTGTVDNNGIDVTDLNEGVYLVRLKVGNEFITKTLIKM